MGRAGVDRSLLSQTGISTPAHPAGVRRLSLPTSRDTQKQKYKRRKFLLVAGERLQQGRAGSQDTPVPPQLWAGSGVWWVVRSREMGSQDARVLSPWVSLLAS